MTIVVVVVVVVVLELTLMLAIDGMLCAVRAAGGCRRRNRKSGFAPWNNPLTAPLRDTAAACLCTWRLSASTSSSAKKRKREKGLARERDSKWVGMGAN